MDDERQVSSLAFVPEAGLLFQCVGAGAMVAWTWAAREKRFGFPGAWAQSSLAEIRFSQCCQTRHG
jgi:hypothetical protein